MNIEVNEYARTDDGVIGKLIRIERDDIDISLKWYVFYDGKDERYINKLYIVKHYKSIMDLIETGDIVILEYYVAKYKKRITRRFEVFKCNNLVSFNNVHCDFLYDLNKKEFVDGKGYNVKIKKILTHEQFAQNCYEVEV